VYKDGNPFKFPVGNEDVEMLIGTTNVAELGGIVTQLLA
jgi:hypothetical protein